MDISFPQWLKYIFSIGLGFSGILTVILLIKRISYSRMRSLSNPDDYFSNILVAGFLFFTAISLIIPDLIPYLFIYACFLLLYIPIGKLRHAIYFFAARAYLGVFFGRRNVWPVNNKQVSSN